MSKSTSSLDTCEISPVRVNNKHQATPHRTRRKTSRRDQCIDVHNSSTPTQSPGLSNRSLSSPSSSFPYSQDNCPDVVWDYTSPKLPRGSRKKEIKLTVKELLENLNQCQVPESNTQSSQYIKLLENYMAKQNVPNNIRKPGRTKINRKRPHAFEELKKFLETIPRQKKDSESNPRPTEDIRIEHASTKVGNSSKLNISTENFLDGESSECDSTEELWGEADFSFIVKATQELESINPAQMNNTSQDVISTIPETGPSPKTPVRKSHTRRSTEKVSVDIGTYNDLLEQLTNVDWDSVDYDEWDNGFIEDDALSMIPDDVLNGTEVGDKITAPTQPNGNERTGPTQPNGNERTAPNGNERTEPTQPNVINTVGDDRTAPIQTNASNVEEMVSDKRVAPTQPIDGNAVSTVIQGTFSGDTVIYSLKGDAEGGSNNEELFCSELYNSFEDESFEDVSLLCQPDVLSRIDEVESMMSQMPKCTPEEIEKKKDEALKRRRKKP